MTVIQRRQERNGTAAQWTAANPVLAVAEIGVESDTLKFKIGDGTAAWAALAYAGFVADGSVTPAKLSFDPATQAELDTAAALLIPLAQKGAVNGVATLGADQKIPGSQLPSLAIGETFTVASQAAMLALIAQRGDVAVRTDLDPDGFFLLSADTPGTLASWVQITAPGAVTSVDGQTGAVALNATYVPKWKANTAYTAGQHVLNPSGQIVSANVAFTSGATYSAANWSAVSSGARLAARMFYVQDAAYGAVAYATQALALAGVDSTNAIKAATDAALAAGGGTVVFDPGFYRVSGALDTTRRGNAQIPLPLQDIDSPKISISWYCHEPAAAEVYPHGVNSTSSAGAILVSSLTGQTFNATKGIPAVVGGPTSGGSGGAVADEGMPLEGFTNVYFTVHGIAVRTQANPTLTAWDLGGVIAGNFADLRADTTDVGTVIATQPSSAHAFGLILPRPNNNVLNRVGNFTCVGYFAGLMFAEHAVVDNCQFLYNVVALVPIASAHAAQLGAVCIERCKYGISYVHPQTGLTFSGAAPAASFTIEHFDYENVIVWSADNWFGVFLHLNDGFNSYTGAINYSFSGGFVTPFISAGGGRNLLIRDRRSQQQSKVAIGPAVTTALAAGTGTITVPATCSQLIPVVMNGTTYYVPGFAASPVTIVTHSFTAANSTTVTPAADTGQAGTVLSGTWGISTNKAYQPGGVQYGALVYDSGRADGVVQADITTGADTSASANINVGLIARAADNNNLLMLEMQKNRASSLDAITLYTKIGGVFAGIGQKTAAGLAYATTYTVKMVLTGSTVQVYLNGVLQFTVTQATGLEGNTKHGIMQSAGQDGDGTIFTSATSRFDDLTITS